MSVPELGVPDYVRLSRHEFDLSDDGHEVVELGVTNETDTTLRLAPDGAGGVEFAVTSGGSSESLVPYYIAVGDTYTVPLYKQALFAEAIEVDGALVVNGLLIGVD